MIHDFGVPVEARVRDISIIVTTVLTASVLLISCISVFFLFLTLKNAYKKDSRYALPTIIVCLL